MMSILLLGLTLTLAQIISTQGKFCIFVVIDLIQHFNTQVFKYSVLKDGLSNL